MTALIRILTLTALLFPLGCREIEAPDEGLTRQGILACRPGDETGDICCPGSPIVIDMAGNGIHLTAPESGVLFQLNPDRLGFWSWTPAGSDDVFLATDVDNDGVINSGLELFGDNSVQSPTSTPNGFNALAFYDAFARGGNADGTIDDNDAIWARLLLWRDINHDGWSAPGELTPIAVSPIHSISLAYSPTSHTDEHGNEFRFSTTINADPPVTLTASDIWLQQIPIPVDDERDAAKTVSSEGSASTPDHPGILDTLWTCWAWTFPGHGVIDPGSPIPLPSHYERCDAPGVLNDPIFDTPWGQHRLVARSGSSVLNEATARANAVDNLFDAYAPRGASYVCAAMGNVTPDFFRAPPYIDSGFIRLKCTLQPIPGGGSGC